MFRIRPVTVGQIPIRQTQEEDITLLPTTGARDFLRIQEVAVPSAHQDPIPHLVILHGHPVQDIQEVQEAHIRLPEVTQVEVGVAAAEAAAEVVVEEEGNQT